MTSCVLNNLTAIVHQSNESLHHYCHTRGRVSMRCSPVSRFTPSESRAYAAGIALAKNVDRCLPSQLARLRTVTQRSVPLFPMKMRRQQWQSREIDFVRHCVFVVRADSTTARRDDNSKLRFPSLFASAGVAGFLQWPPARRTRHVQNSRMAV